MNNRGEVSSFYKEIVMLVEKLRYVIKDNWDAEVSVFRVQKTLKEVPHFSTPVVKVFLLNGGQRRVVFSFPVERGWEDKDASFQMKLIEFQHLAHSRNCQCEIGLFYRRVVNETQA